ncbi:hypothetical protein [Shewanella sp. TC10]|uniref:hypothetical protein n=1 Tax=Shewanella sp. TC10 TaxID=1419739 RepID=UPI00129E23DD|nr:hypothetical protein [Shewanella sp. TC10]
MVNPSLKTKKHKLNPLPVSFANWVAGGIATAKAWLIRQKIKLIIVAVIAVTVFIAVKPQEFADLWFTRDQQGMLLFKLGRYEQAANQFETVRWQAYSQYGGEEFDLAAILYDQFDDISDQIARANALAHARRYVAARKVYLWVLEQSPDNEQATHNLALVQAIIDEVNRIAESQQSESGDSPQDLGDDPQTGDGADKKEMVLKVAEKYDAQQLLLDPKLNEMWLRQVQKDPGRFLASKFQMQTELPVVNTDENTANGENE